MSRVCVSTDHVVDTGRLYRSPPAAHLGSDQGNSYTFSGFPPQPMIFVDEPAGGIQNTWYNGDVSFPPIFLGAPDTRRSEVKVGKSGWYTVGCSIGWAVGADPGTIPYTYLRSLVTQNGTPVCSDTLRHSALVSPTHSAKAIVLARAGDLFTCFIQADTTKNLTNLNFIYPVLTVVWRGGTRLL